MLDLALFRIRNFWVANLTTLTAYAGLIAGLFFLTLFLQQVAGYSALEAGLATTPDSLLLFALSPRFGRIASETGPRLLMCVGPIVGGLGLLLLLRVGSDPDYLTEVLPAVVVFGLGLSATVAPLTATVLDSVEQRHAGVASGINNGVARVAGLLAIAVLGAVISASFASTLDSNLGDRPLGPEATGAVSDAKEQPLAVPTTEQLAAPQAERVRTASADASTSGFHLGILIASLLMIAGGVVAGMGIENPRRAIEAVPAGASAAAGECGHGLDADCAPEEALREAPAAEPA
jgi:MFS family permease